MTTKANHVKWLIVYFLRFLRHEFPNIHNGDAVNRYTEMQFISIVLLNRNACASEIFLYCSRPFSRLAST